MTPLPLKIYRLLLKLYPAGFREEFSGPLERQFRDESAEAMTRAEHARLWLRLLADFAVSLPVQVAREVRQDARHAVRMWMRKPLPAVLAVAALAIGIGANTGVFTVVNAVLLRSLPFREPDRLAELTGYMPVNYFGGAGAFQEWARRCRYVDDAVIFTSNEMNLRGTRESHRIRVTESSSRFFTMFGQPAFGRGFRPEEETPGRDGVAVISHGLWQQLFGGAPDALGRTVYVNDVPLTVIGVAQPQFDYPDGTAIWTPSAFNLSHISKTGVTFLRLDVRLRNGWTWARAQQALQAEAAPVLAKEAKFAGFEPKAELTPLRKHLAGPVHHASLVLMGAVALVLLIACANVANLLLARTVDRSGELLVRSALGASRARLMQQLLTECVLLSLIAAGAGVLVARWLIAVAAQAQPVKLAAQAYTLSDWHVAAFTAGLSLATALLFGMLPALHASRMGVSATVVRNPNARRGAGRLRWALVSIQVALSVVLLAGAVVLGRAFLKIMHTDCGYEVRNTVTMSISLAGSRYEKDPRRARAYYDEVFRRLRALPGVVAAGGTEYLPLEASAFMASSFGVEGRPNARVSLELPSTPGVFRAFGAHLLAGREFQPGDERLAEPPAIVSSTIAPGVDPRELLGQKLNGEKRTLRIIGVVAPLSMAGPIEASNDMPQVFPLSHDPNFMTFVVRVRGEAKRYADAVWRAVRDADPQVPVFDAQTMEERLANATARPAFYTTAVLFFGGFALLLAVLGIYGVVAYAVAQSAHEIGIRLALGTTAVRLRAGLLARGMTAVAAGAVPGIAGALACGHYLVSLVERAEPAGALICAAVVLLLSTVAAAAVWAATRRMGRLDLAELLRAE